MILGITGYKRHGKDSVCEAVCAFEPRARRIALADPLKAIAREVYGLSVEQTDGDLKESLDERWGLSARQIMQRLGTEVARSIHADTWVRYLLAQITKHPQNTLWVVPDVRFMNEALALRVDAQIMNSGSLDDLRVQVRSALHQLLRGST